MHDTGKKKRIFIAMPDGSGHVTTDSKPTLKDLGFDLLKLKRWQLVMTLFLPFCFFVSYFVFATNDPCENQQERSIRQQGIS